MLTAGFGHDFFFSFAFPSWSELLFLFFLVLCFWCTYSSFVLLNSATGFWHLLDKRVKATGVRGSIIKVAADLATMNVLMTYSFIAWSKAWSDFEKSEPVSTKEVVEFTNERFPSTILRSYIYWLPLHCITYGVVPTRHRLVWVSVCSVGFAALLSYSAGQCAGGQPEMPSESTASKRMSDMVLVQAPAAPPPPGPPTAPPPPEDEPLSPHGVTAPHLR